MEQLLQTNLHGIELSPVALGDRYVEATAGWSSIEGMKHPAFRLMLAMTSITQKPAPWLARDIENCRSWGAARKHSQETICLMLSPLPMALSAAVFRYPLGMVL